VTAGRKVPIGGTSAGLAVLGKVDFAALNGSIDSNEALAAPYQRKLTLDRGFLTAPGLAATVTDSHFRSRDRMGRLLTFVSRMVQDRWASVATARGIGVDEETALVVEAGVGTRLGLGSVYFLRPSVGPAVCRKRNPLTMRNLQVERLSPGSASFNLDSWTGNGTTRYELSAESGVLTSSQPGGRIY
jgi:cyanophycinase-like exopeptidase